MQRYWSVQPRKRHRVDLKGVLVACAFVAGIALVAGGRGDRLHEPAHLAPAEIATGDAFKTTQQTGTPALGPLEGPRRDAMQPGPYVAFAADSLSTSLLTRPVTDH